MNAPAHARVGQRRLIAAIAGRNASSARYDEATANAAHSAGRIAATLGLTVLTGGLSGVMERAAEGAKSVGGTTIGIVPSSRHEDGNPFLDYILPSGIGIARNYLLANACDFLVALPGGTGTLEEICFALDVRRPVLSWGSWEIDGVQTIPFPDEPALHNALSELLAATLQPQEQP